MGLDFNINSTTRQIECFKTRIVAHGQPQILGFDCYDVHAPTIGLPHVWKLRSPLEGTRPAAMRWTQSSSIPIQSFGFVPIVSGRAFWLCYHSPDAMLLCTHVDDLLPSASTTPLAWLFYSHYALSHDCKFFLARTFVGIDILLDRAAHKMYLSHTASSLICSGSGVCFIL